MVVTIPAKTNAAAHRNPNYISASTQSMVIAQVSGSTTTTLATANLAPSSPGCSVTSGGTTQCTVSFITTAGSDTFKMSMYDQPNGKGNLLSTGETPAETITAGQANTVNVTLDGVPASLSVVLGAGTLPVGTASTTSLTVVAEDADDNVIVGPGGFSSAISLAITGDTYKTLSVTYGQGQSSITSPGQAATLAYTGASNVGSTITASTTGATSGSATFAGSGAAMTVMAYNTVMIAGEVSYAYPETIAGYPDGSGAAAVSTIEICCSTYAETDAVGTVSASGTWQFFVGPGSSFASMSGVTTVTGMSPTIEYDGYEAYDDIAVDTNKNVYYSGYSAADCYVIGKLNPSAGTTTETVLQGEAMYPHVDSSGNVWFLEESSTCSSSNGSGFASGWGVGELSAGGTLTERDLGISEMDANDMAISPDGSTMYIANGYNNNTINKVTTSTLAPSALTLVDSLSPDAIAADASGDVVWDSDSWTDDNIYFGSTTSSFTSLYEAPFPVPYFESYSMTYADGSIWAGSDYSESGFGRFSNLASGTPATAYYDAPTSDGIGQELCGVGAAGGIVWGADCDYGAVDIVQYGAPSTTGATVTFNSVRRLGQQIEPKNAHLKRPAHAKRT
jgi:hypothetical protein